MKNKEPANSKKSVYTQIKKIKDMQGSKVLL